ncbi:MAG: phosphoribosylaminoimidazolesuccinocarboxamide synthase [Nanoarchaeota archaeon]
MLSTDDIRSELNNTLERTDLGIGERHEGKVRDSYVLAGKRILVTTDRLSCFDKIVGTVPFKGQVLNQMAAYWFAETEGVIRNHLLEVPDPNVMVVKECVPLPVEVIVRGYITGSLWRDYASGKRNMYGLRFPEGLAKDEQLPEPIITPTTKALHGAHDIPISKDEILRRRICMPKSWERVEEAALGLYRKANEVLAERNLILVDTKYEFGTLGKSVVLMDEIHTPDSSRYWYRDSFFDLFREGKDQKSMDKEFVRQWLLGQGFSGDGIPPKLPDEIKIEAARRYIEVFEQITGQEFKREKGAVLERIRKRLAPYLKRK